MGTETDITPLDDDARWAAVAACDRSYDGRFLYGVATTGVFCRPSCRSRTPLRENVAYFDTAGQALARGYRPCRRCRPDLPAHDPARELVQAAQALLTADGALPPSPEALAARLGVSPLALRRAFKAVLGVTPARYRARIKVARARVLLLESDAPITRIALECGFESLSSFYKHFTQHAGAPPARFRAAKAGTP